MQTLQNQMLIQQLFNYLRLKCLWKNVCKIGKNIEIKKMLVSIHILTKFSITNCKTKYQKWNKHIKKWYLEML